MKKSMMFRDDIRSFFIDITDYHTGFGPVIDFDWQGDNAVVIKPKDEKIEFNTAFKRMFKDAVESIKGYIERHPDYSITYYDEDRCVVCISEGNTVKSTKKMKKSDDDYAQAFSYFDSGRVYLNGYPVDWKNMDDIIDGIEGYFDDKGRVLSVAHQLLETINRGEDFDYEDQFTLYFEVTIEKSAQKSYIPEYHDFHTMVGKMRSTRNNKNVFKE